MFSSYTKAMTCAQWIEKGLVNSMNVQISPGGDPFFVYCDVESEGGVGVAVIRKFSLL